MHKDVPSSLVTAEDAARATVGFAGVVSMLELLLACRGNDAWILFVTIFPPIVVLGFAMRPLVRREWRKLAKVSSVGFGIHALVALLFAIGIGGVHAEIIAIALFMLAMLFAFTAFTALPLLVAGVVLGTRRDLEAGDAMLGWSGAWLVLLQALALAAASDSRDAWGSSFVAVIGLGVGLLALGTYAGRALTRRRWCARVLRGELQGWRVRETTSPEELATLPPVFGSARKVSGVVERVEMGGVLYRSGLVASPVAAVRVRRAFVPGATDLGAGLVP